MDGVWEFYKPEMEVQSGDDIRYRVTVYHEEGTELTEWKFCTYVYNKLQHALHKRIFYLECVNQETH